MTELKVEFGKTVSFGNSLVRIGCSIDRRSLALVEADMQLTGKRCGCRLGG